MKTIHLEVKVPDEYNDEIHFPCIDIREAPGGDIVWDSLDFVEIHPPTEEDYKEAFGSHKASHHQVFKWVINKLKEGDNLLS